MEFATSTCIPPDDDFRPSSRMDAALTALSRATESLAKEMDSLDARLRPILREAYETTEDVVLAEIAEAGGPMTDHVRDTARRIEGLRAHVADLLSRLDV